MRGLTFGMGRLLICAGGWRWRLGPVKAALADPFLWRCGESSAAIFHGYRLGLVTVLWRVREE
jgi:hypothetical protein